MFSIALNVIILNVLFVSTDAFSLARSEIDWKQRHIAEMIVVQERYSFLSSSTQAQKNAEREPWELPISRTVRAAGKAQPGQCCIKPKEELSDKMKSSYLNCFKETRPSMNKAEDNETKKHWIRYFICLSQCVGNKYDVLDEKNFLVKDKFMAHIRNENQTDEVFTQKEEIITRCIDFSNQFSKERGDVDFFGKSCNMAPLAFVQCIKGFEQINCPEELKVKSSLCEMARMRIEELILIWKI